MRLGEGYVWDFGKKECITSTEFAVRMQPGVPGFCTEVGKVADNKGYDVKKRPALRLSKVIASSGSC